MKQILFFLLIAVSSFAQTKGEIKNERLDYTEFNSFLSKQSIEGRKVERLAEFKTKEKTVYSFYAIINVSTDSASVSYGDKFDKLAPFNYLVVASTFDSKGVLKQAAPYIHVSSDVKDYDLYCVYKICSDCKVK
jgi:hypothetical protein